MAYFCLRVLPAPNSTSSYRFVFTKTATIIASMLVSPLMGPVMGMAYAATIQDFKMFRIACFTEIVSLLSCIIIGVIVSLSMTPFKVSEDFPTYEQSSRGTVENLYIGIPVAFFSGLGVAVSVLDEQTSSLVGVAISASLLPPAVNAGMLWATHFFYKGEGEAPIGLLQDGLISLVLTIVNIIMIIISSMIMFRLKEVRVILGVLLFKPFYRIDIVSSHWAVLPMT